MRRRRRSPATTRPDGGESRARLPLAPAAMQSKAARHAIASRLPRRGAGSLRVDDAAARGHPVDRAGLDRLHGAEAVAVHDLALEQIGNRREPDVRMRPDRRCLRRAPTVPDPMWSKNTTGPMRRRAGDGRMRATVKPPRSRARPSIIVSIMTVSSSGGRASRRRAARRGCPRARGRCQAAMSIDAGSR